MGTLSNCPFTQEHHASQARVIQMTVEVLRFAGLTELWERFNLSWRDEDRPCRSKHFEIEVLFPNDIAILFCRLERDIDGKWNRGSFKIALHQLLRDHTFECRVNNGLIQVIDTTIDQTLAAQGFFNAPKFPND